MKDCNYAEEFINTFTSFPDHHHGSQERVQRGHDRRVPGGLHAIRHQGRRNDSGKTIIRNISLTCFIDGYYNNAYVESFLISTLKITAAVSLIPAVASIKRCFFVQYVQFIRKIFFSS